MAQFESLILLAAALFIKHFLADGPLQSDQQVAKKGVFLHPIGLAHAGVHAALTAACLLGWSASIGQSLGLSFIAAIAALEFFVHYAVDYTKSAVDRANEWSVRVSEDCGAEALQIKDKKFFIAFLADQTAHSLTYIFIIYMVGAHAF